MVKDILVVAHGKKIETCYMVELHADDVNSVNNDVGHPTTLWYQRLGHMSEKAIVENKTWSKIKCLKFDNDGKYSSTEFIDYCVENGIRMLKIIPKTSQQNSVVDRMNKTLN